MAARRAAGSPVPDLSPEAAIEDFLHALRRPTRLLVAISGGSDSTGLLLSLQRAIETQSFPHQHTLTAATVDHALRPGSADEARAVATLCENLRIPHRIARWSDAKPEQGLPAAARQARYRLLADVADALGADAIVTGHTLDDQMETVAMRADRSTDGALGLAGMAPATIYGRRLWILRPFLRTRRSAIRSYLDGLGQRWIDDPSNEDPRYERIRIRQSAPTISPLAIEEAARKREALSLGAAQWLRATAEVFTGPVVKIALASEAPQPAEVRDHALSTLTAILGGKLHRSAATSLGRLADALDAGNDFRLTMSGCLVLRRGKDLFLLRERRGFLPLSVPPSARMVWDGRYLIENRSAGAVTVNAGPAIEIISELPGAVRSALAANCPQVIVGKELSEKVGDRITITPRLSLFADFMPGFDQPLADAIARILGAEPAPPSPI
ncbi:MAG: tRNA lysidine(34) synthetase TilS [Allorhizobium sp.]